METSAPVVEVNGAPVTPADLELLAFSNLTATTRPWQVRQHAVRGLDLAPVQVDENARILFGQTPDPGPGAGLPAARRWDRTSLLGPGHAVQPCAPLPGPRLRGRTDIMVAVSPPDEPQNLGAAGSLRGL